MKEGKYCPILCVRGGTFWTCQKEECAFWTFMWTIENIQIWDCAIVLNAMKNSEGKIPV